MAGKASAGISLRSITTLRSRSSNPWKIVLATNPGGGTMPMRKPSGNTGSAPSAGMPAARAQIRISHVTKRGMETLTRCRGPMARNRAIIRRQRHSGSRFAHAPERQIDAAAVRQQGRGAGHDAVDPVEGETRLAAQHDRVSRGQAKRARRLAPPGAADAEQAGVAERQ